MRLISKFRRLRFSSDADIVLLTNARIIIIIIINTRKFPERLQAKTPGCS